jgi:hypothetical protein
LISPYSDKNNKLVDILRVRGRKTVNHINVSRITEFFKDVRVNYLVDQENPILPLMTLMDS